MRKTAKVIPLWAGARRQDLDSEIGSSRDNLDLLKFVISKERELDQGTPTDTIFVHNQAVEDDVDDVGLYQEYIDLLNSTNGSNTRNGKFIVLHRKNSGISFGAFDYAYQHFKEDYFYWMFNEDDFLILKEGYIKENIHTLHHSNRLIWHTKERADPDVAFVITMGGMVWMKQRRPLVLGGCSIYGGNGLTTSKTIEKIGGSYPWCETPEGENAGWHKKIERQICDMLNDNEVPIIPSHFQRDPDAIMNWRGPSQHSLGRGIPHRWRMCRRAWDPSDIPD